MSRRIFAGIMTTAILWSGLSHAGVKDGIYAELLPAQATVLEASYPGYKMFRSCAGHFGGLNDNDVVLGINSNSGVHRIGLVWDGENWTVHDIDAEILKDSDISHSWPMDWNASIGGDPKEDFRCAFQLGKDDRIGGMEGDEPFFNLKRLGLEKSTAVCFETNDTYNNWDCVVYSPKDKRFRLWFQQAHAD